MKTSSPLRSHFTVSETRIQLHNERITPEEFAAAVIEFCHGNDHFRSRLGDLLNEYAKRFDGERLRNDLITTLVEKELVSRKTCDNARSFAKKYETRWDSIPDAWAEEIITIPNEKKRSEVRRVVEKRRDNGKKINLERVRALTRAAKKRV